jgi:hypothetical protein
MKTHRQSECNVQECSSSSELMRTQNYFNHKIKEHLCAQDLDCNN